MSLYLPYRASGNAAISICGRCAKKIYYSDLVLDPNNKNYYCPECVDLFDPWRLPARKAEDISLKHPRPDIPVYDPDGNELGTESGLPIDFPPEVTV